MEDSFNPYQSPTFESESKIEEFPEDRTPVPATAGLRFANLVIDQIVQYVASIALGVFIVIVGGDEGIELIEKTPGMVFGLPIFFIYFFGMEAATGRTFGKLLTGTKVVDENGEDPSIGKLLGRTFARLIPFDAFSFLGSQPRGWHDSLSKTYVVKVR